jgi:hypothetical protein
MVHRTVSGAPGWSPVKRPLLGKDQRRTTIIHWTVRWCTGLSDEPTVASATVGRTICRRRVPATTVGRGHRTVWCSPDSVRCANGTEAATVDCACFGRQSRTGQLQGMSGGAPDCPLHHTIEGNISLPRLSSTTPSCLGAIKGTPRRMEELHKHSLSILRHPDSVPSHSFRCVRDLSTIRVKDSLCCHLSSSILLCAWVCYNLCLVCVAHPNLTPCFHCDLCCKGERLQSCGDFSQTGIII